MTSKTASDKEQELLERIRDEYIASDSVTLKILSAQHGVPFAQIMKKSREEKWSAQRKQAHTLKNEKNGGLTEIVDDASNNDLKGGPPLPRQNESTVEEEASELRDMAFKLAMRAGSTLNSKEEWIPKDFELFIGTWVKITGSQAKLDGDTDGIEKLIGELTGGDEYPDET